jgi:Arc/MetJ family transcription regulator
MTRTTIDIDDALLARVMCLHNFQTKREAIDYALRMLDARPLSREEILGLEGMGWGVEADPARFTPDD